MEEIEERPSAPPSLEDEKSFYKIAIEARNFEIDNVLKRANIFWLFTAGAFLAFYAAKSEIIYSIVISSVGFFCTACWSMVNRGSKFWQNNYEYWLACIEQTNTWFLKEKKHVDIRMQKRFENENCDSEEAKYRFIEMEAVKRAKGLYSGALNGLEDGFWTLRYSPSKLLISCSDFLTVVWFLLLVYANCNLLFPSFKYFEWIFLPLFSIITVVWVCVLIWDVARGED